MKKFIFIFIALIFTLNIDAQERPAMHAIVFADTDDGKIGKGEAVSLDEFKDFLQTVCNTINHELIIDPYLYTGTICRSKELIDLLDEFECDTNDIVVFCYLGHGTRSHQDTSVFPQMCLHEQSQSKYVPLIDVSKSLAQHRAKLTVVIGDCCNYPGEFVLPKVSKDQPAAATKIPSATISLFKELFTNTTGVITMCATKPGTYGWSNSATGSYFLNSLMQTIEETPINSIKPGNPWESIMDIVMKDLWQYNFKDKNNPSKTHKMSPCYRIEPRKKKTKPNGIIPPRVNNLQQLISDVANANLQDSERSERKKQVLLELTPNSLIRTVSSDGSVAFNRPYKAEAYLDRIIKLRDIININIKNIHRDNSGKITLLEVHEVYKINQ